MRLLHLHYFERRRILNVNDNLFFVTLLQHVMANPCVRPCVRHTWCCIETSVFPGIDVKNVFYVFYSGHVFLRFLTFFFILPTFLFLKTFIENTI